MIFPVIAILVQGYERKLVTPLIIEARPLCDKPLRYETQSCGINVKR